MEEERGHFSRCQQILNAGLHHCPLHDGGPMLKAIKHHERMGNLGGARSLLGLLRSVPIDKSWRTLLEGALLEARAAETPAARRVFKFLLQHAPWYGPVWHEACRFSSGATTSTRPSRSPSSGCSSCRATARSGSVLSASTPCAPRERSDQMRARARSSSAGCGRSRRTSCGSCGSRPRRSRSARATSADRARRTCVGAARARQPAVEGVARRRAHRALPPPL